MARTVSPLQNAAAHRLSLLLGYGIAGICLAWVLYHVHPGRLLRHTLQLNWYLVLLATAVDALNYVLQGLRWRFLLKPLVYVRASDTIRGIYVGLFMNEVFPMRLGELVRSQLLARWYSASLSDIIPSMVVERLLEGGWLALGMGLAALFLPLPSHLQRGAQIFGSLIVVLTFLFFYVILRKGKRLPLGNAKGLEPKLPGRAALFIGHLAAGLRRIGLSDMFFAALALTLACLILQASSLWLLMRAYGLSLVFWKGAVVLLIVRLGVLVPSAPANIGTYQFFTALGLELFGIDRSVATGFSIVSFFIFSAPLWLIGFIALSYSGMSVFRLRSHVMHAASPLTEAGQAAEPAQTQQEH